VGLGLELLHLARWPVADGEKNGIQNSEGPLRLSLQHLASAIFEHGHIDVVLGLANTCIHQY